MINEFGFNEECWGNVEQWQTLNKPRIDARKDGMARYAGFESLNWHPYEDLPILPTEQRYASFCRRFDAAVERHQMKGSLQ